MELFINLENLVFYAHMSIFIKFVFYMAMKKNMVLKTHSF